MELDVSKGFLHPATAFPFEAEVPLDEQDVNGDAVSFDPVALSGTYMVADDVIVLKGHLSTIAHAACALCMEPAEAPVQTDFEETFRKDANETEDESFRYEGKAVPLDHMTLTLVLLNMPMRYTCAGCEQSAQPLPQSSCDDGAPMQRPFEALRSLLKEDEEV